MTSITIENAQATYKGTTEAELLINMAKAWGCRLIYKYAHGFGDKITPTDYKIVMAPGDAQEQALLNSPYVYNLVLIYKDGKVVYEPV